MKKKNLKFIIFLLAITFVFIYFSNQIKPRLNQFIINNSSEEILSSNEINSNNFREINEKLLNDIIDKYKINLNSKENQIVNKDTNLKDIGVTNNSSNNSNPLDNNQNIQNNDFNKNIKNNTNESNYTTNFPLNKIDINKANLKKLESIPGIGPVLANRIIEYRNINGKFKSLSDLLKIKGIGPKTLEKIKPYIKIQ